MKAIGGQTKTDISTGQKVPYFTGENGHFSIKNLLISISVYNSIVENLVVIILTHCLENKKNQKKLKNQICVLTPVVTVLIF